MFPATTLSNTHNCSPVKQHEYIFKQLDLVYLGYFLLGLIVLVVIVLLMQNNFICDSNYNSTENYPVRNSDTELTTRLIIQLRHNIAYPINTLAYNRFPENHPGHLRLELRIKLANILRTSFIADQYRFGCTMGTIYKRGTHSYPDVSPEMAGVVLSIESRPW